MNVDGVIQWGIFAFNVLGIALVASAGWIDSIWRIIPLELSFEREHVHQFDARLHALLGLSGYGEFIPRGVRLPALAPFRVSHAGFDNGVWDCAP